MSNIARKENLKIFEQKIEKLQEPIKQIEAKVALDYILNGRRIALTEKGEIFLFPEKIPLGKVEPCWSITENKKLYSLLEDLVQS